MIVADAGPLIALARAGLLELLPRLLGQVVLPPAVFGEITIAPGKPGAAEVRTAGWVAVQEIPAEAVKASVSRNLGLGEREAIQLAHILAHILKAVLLLDERRARREAEGLGIPLTSTLALLEEAKRQGIIPSLAEALDRLQASSFRLSRHLRATVLRRAGET